MHSKNNNSITIAKAIGIIFMVIGHSGCPTFLCRFLYLFHMPLFFVCSGYFFKEISDRPSLFLFYKKRMKKLYLPYLKWSLVFLVLHNSLCKLNITDDFFYQSSDYIKQFFKLIAMTEFELLIRPFWFIKELLFASLIVATISLLRSRYFPKISIGSLIILSLLSSTLAKYVSIIPLIGDCSVLFLSISYYYMGILFHKYQNRLPMKYSVLILLFIIVISGSFIFPGFIDMRYTTAYNNILYFCLSLFGIQMLFIISRIIDNKHTCPVLNYIGNHTMPILALNLLTLKIGNLLKIWFYDLPIDRLSSHTVIYDHNSYFWLIYTTIGVTIPIFAYILYSKVITRYRRCS